MKITKKILKNRRIRANVRDHQRQLISRSQAIENLIDCELTEEEIEELLPPLTTTQYALKLHKNLNLFWNQVDGRWVKQSLATIYKSKSDIPKLPVGKIVQI